MKLNGVPTLTNMKPAPKWKGSENKWHGLNYLPRAQIPRLFKQIKDYDEVPRETEPFISLRNQLNHRWIYLPAQGKRYKAFAVKVTPDFIKWLFTKHGAFNDLSIYFQLTRQQRYNTDTRETTYYRQWLLSYNYDQIIGGSHLRYFTHSYARKYFKGIE